MSSGLKNLQSASRACARRERLENGGVLDDHHSHGAYGDSHGTDDSGIGIEDLEAEYSPDGGSFGSSPERTYGGESHHQRQMSDGRSSTYDSRDRMSADGRGYMQQGMQQIGGGMQQRPPYGMSQRLPSIDMGIGAIINRNPGI